MSTPPVILIIEDEDFLRSSLADYLEDHGHTVMTSPNAEDGLRQVETGKPRICIVDMRLPDMNGNEFILRANSIDQASGSSSSRARWNTTCPRACRPSA